MHRDFAYCLYSLLHQSPDTINDGIAPKRLPVVEDAPSEAEALLGSPVVFEICAKSKENPFHGKPQELAEKLCATFMESEFGTRFSVMVAGGGYVNASPSDQFYTDFFEALRASPGMLLGEGRFNAPDTMKPARLIFDAEHVLKVLRRNDRQDILEFVTRGRDGAAVSLDDFLMLCAISVDNDIDAAAYCSDFHSTENIPWLFRRAQGDARQYERYLERLLGGAKNSTVMFESMPTYSRILVFDLLRFRHEVFVGEGTIAAPRLVGMLRTAVRGFYQIYNRPQCRYADGEDAAVLVAHYVLARGLAGLLEQTESMLGKCCEEAQLVLDSK